MGLLANEQDSGGFVRDLDGRMIVGPGLGNLLFAPINTSSSGASQLVAANATARIWVVSYVVVAASAVSVKFQAATFDLTGALPLAANGGVVALGSFQVPLFATAANQALNINLGSAVQVSGHFSYFVQS